MQTSSSRLGELILLRLLAAGRPPSRSALDQALKPYFLMRLGLTDGQWRTLLTNTLDELVNTETIQAKPYALTKNGERACRAGFRIAELPGDCRWVWLRNRHVIARALDVHPQNPAEWETLASADGMRAAVLVEYYELELSPFATLSEVFQALLESRVPSEERGSRPKAIARDELLRDELIPNQAGDLKVRLPAIVTRAQNNSMESLRQAVINNWLNNCDRKPPPASNSAPEKLAFSELDTLQSFARQVQELAQHTDMEKFGGNKVFLSHLWESYAKQASEPIARKEFDRTLLEANRQNLITLSRADLISAMNYADVEASEISLPHATFHFIRTDVAPAENSPG